MLFQPNCDQDRWLGSHKQVLEADQLDDKLTLQSSILLMTTGFNFYLPVLSTEMTLAYNMFTQAKVSLDEVMQCNLLEWLPQCDIKARLQRLLPLVETTKEYLETINLNDGSGLSVVVDPLICELIAGESSHQSSASPNLKRKRDSSLDTSLVEGAETREAAEKRCKRPDNFCFCGKECQDLEMLATHQKKKHANNKWDCSKCAKVFSTQGSLWKHVRVFHLGEYLYICHLCPTDPYSSDEKENLYRHYIGEHPNSESAKEVADKVPKCGKCGNMYSSISAVRKHEKHCGTTVKPFACEEDTCGQSFNSQQTLTRHQQMAHPEEGQSQKGFKCSYCSQFYTYKWSLDTHLEDAHDKPKSKAIKEVVMPPYRLNKQ